MKRRFVLGASRLNGLILVLGLLLAFNAPAAMAQSLDELRASGAIGERYDGYVAVRDSGAAGAKSVAKEVNAKRRSLYEERAAAQGVKPEDVGRVYAGQIMQKAPGGTWFLDENGNWRQK
jgi:uncharacterized protein YdbL (DUF1318 family)